MAGTHTCEHHRRSPSSGTGSEHAKNGDCGGYERVGSGNDRYGRQDAGDDRRSDNANSGIETGNGEIEEGGGKPEKEKTINKEIPKSGNFRFQRRYVLLTYKSHIPKYDYIQWLSAKTHLVLAFCRIAHETGDECQPYAHSHVLVDFGKIFQTKDLHFFCHTPDETDNHLLDECGKIHCNIKFLPSRRAFEDAKIYIAKEDTANADLAQQVNIIDKIQGATSINDALRLNVEKPSDAIGVMAIYNMRNDISELACEKPDFPWHRDFLEWYESAAHAPLRTIRWYYDENGNTGKTWLLRYLEDNYRDANGYDWFPMAGIENMRETANLMMKAAQTGWKTRGVIIDLTRSYELGRKLYDTLENVKNGRISSTKYNGGRLRFQPPWVVVLSNWWPNTSMMSTDRWDIWEITKERTAVQRSVNHSTHRSANLAHMNCPTCSCNRTFNKD